MAMLKVIVKDKNSAMMVRFEMDSQSTSYQNLSIEEDDEVHLLKNIHFDQASITIITDDNDNQNKTYEISDFNFDKKQEKITYIQNTSQVNLNKSISIEQKITIEDIENAARELNITIPHSTANLKTEPVSVHPLQDLNEILAELTLSKNKKPEKTYMSLEEIQAAQSKTEMTSEPINLTEESYPSRIYSLRLPSDKPISLEGKNYDTLRVIAVKTNNLWVAQEIWAGNSGGSATEFNNRILLNAKILPLQNAINSINSKRNWHLTINDGNEPPKTISLNSSPKFETLTTNDNFSELMLGSDSILVPHDLNPFTVQATLDTSETYKIKPIKSLFSSLKEKIIGKTDSFPYQEILFTVRTYTGINEPLAIEMHGLVNQSYRDIAEYEDNLTFEGVFKNKKYQFNYDKSAGKLELIALEKNAPSFTFALDTALTKPKFSIKTGELSELNLPITKMDKNPAGTIHGVMPRTSHLPKMTLEEETKNTKPFARTESFYVAMPTIKPKVKRVSEVATKNNDEIIAQEINQVTEQLNINAGVAIDVVSEAESTANAGESNLLYIIYPAATNSKTKSSSVFEEIQLILTPDFKFASAVGIHRDKTFSDKNFTPDEFKALLATSELDSSQITQELPNGITHAFENCNLVAENDIFKVILNIKGQTDPFNKRNRGTLPFPLPGEKVDRTEPQQPAIQQKVHASSETSPEFPIFAEEKVIQTNAEFIEEELRARDKAIQEKAEQEKIAQDAVEAKPASMSEPNVAQVPVAAEAPAQAKPKIPIKKAIMSKIARRFRETIPTYAKKHAATTQKLKIGEVIHQHLNETQRKLYKKNYNDPDKRFAELIKNDGIYQSLVNLENVYTNSDAKVLNVALDQSNIKEILGRAMDNENQTLDDLQEAQDLLEENIMNGTSNKKFKASVLNQELKDIIRLVETRRDKIDKLQRILVNPTNTPTVYGNLRDNIVPAGNISLQIGSYVLTVDEYNNIRNRLKDANLIDPEINSSLVDNSQAAILSDNPFIAHREAIPAQLADNDDRVICSVLTDKIISTKEGPQVYHGGIISRSKNAILVEKPADVVTVKGKPAQDVFLRNEMLLLQAVEIVKEFKESEIKNPVLTSIDPVFSEILYKVTRAYNYEFENRTLFQCPKNMHLLQWEEKALGNEKKPNMQTLTVNSIRQWLRQHNLLDEKMLAEQLDAYYQKRGIQAPINSKP